MKKISLILILLILSYSIKAQLGVSAGSLQYARNYAQRSTADRSLNEPNYFSKPMPLPDQFVVEDFINYHLHQIDIPKTNDVAISIDYDNTELNRDDEFLLQVGIATQPANLRSSKQNRVNVGLVIDVSGSMSGQKIASVREGVRRLTKSLNNGDYLSIVLFDSEARVVLKSTSLQEDRSKIYTIIDEIDANNATNLNAGMLLGYQEVMKNHSPIVNSRVILLTDGETNTGEINPDRIINNSLTYNEKGIDISTIGVGQYLNFNLLQELSEKGRGSNYFIGEKPEDMYKIFSEELDGIMYGIGKEASITITIPKGWEIMKCYGYKPLQEGDNTLVINLSNLVATSTRIILLKVRKNETTDGTITARINYKSMNGKSISVVEEKNYNTETKSTNSEIGKNFDIALMAQSLKDASEAYIYGNFCKKDMILNMTKGWMDKSNHKEDKDFQRVYEILEEYVPNKQNNIENKGNYGILY